MFRELIQDHISNRGKIVPAGEIFPAPYHNTRYCSLFMFDKDILAFCQDQQVSKRLQRENIL
jgi:hypothetical protein